MMISVKRTSVAVVVAVVSAATTQVRAAEEVRVATDSKVPKTTMVSDSGAAPLTRALARYAASVARELDQAQTPVASPTPAPTKSWRQRHPVAAGALIGATIGAAVGGVSGALAQEHNMVTPEGLAIICGGLGAATGAVVGFAIHKGP